MKEVVIRVGNPRGDSNPIAGITMTFDDVGGPLTQDPISSLTYHPTNLDEGDPDTIFSEYEGEFLTSDGATYTQIYMNKMRFRDGRVVLMRELWNPMKVIEATSGASDSAATT